MIDRVCHAGGCLLSTHMRPGTFSQRANANITTSASAIALGGAAATQNVRRVNSGKHGVALVLRDLTHLFNNIWAQHNLATHLPERSGIICYESWRIVKGHYVPDAVSAKRCLCAGVGFVEGKRCSQGRPLPYSHSAVRFPGGTGSFANVRLAFLAVLVTTVAEAEVASRKRENRAASWEPEILCVCAQSLPSLLVYWPTCK